MRKLILGLSSLLTALFFLTATANSGVCPGTPNSTGMVANLEQDGNVLVITNAPANVFGVVIYGAVSADPPIPFGQGNLCIWPFHPSNGRLQVINTSAAGSFVYQGTNIPEDYYAQFWFRDYADGGSFTREVVEDVPPPQKFHFSWFTIVWALTTGRNLHESWDFSNSIQIAPLP
ncbi:MAG: hypothetical protein ABIF88_01980 [archaeon]